MDNFLSNGTVLPSGLLSGSASSMMDGFKKTYQNCYLRIGVVIKTYDIGSPDNVSTDTIEYDVLAWQQNEGGSATAITYKHCVTATSFGSIADFFEARLRQLENKTTAGVTPTPYGQDGAMVLLLCLNGFSDSAIIISSLSNPQRQSTLTGDGLHLEGEYNGVNIKVNSDGSTSLTFNGATDNNGNPVTPGQGPTTVQIATDGSFSVQHSGVTMQLEKNGALNITANGNINITTPDKVVVTAKEIDLNRPDGDEDPTEGIITSAGTYNCVDFITGVPVVPSTTVFGDIGESNV